MPFEVNKVAYVPTGGSEVKGDATLGASGVSDILLPEINEYVNNVTAINNENQYGTVVYNTSNFAFHYIENTRLLNNASGVAVERQFLNIHIPMTANTIPTISGIKIIGTAFSTNSKSFTFPTSPEGSNSQYNFNQRTFMFKLWRNFNWIAPQTSAPFYPRLNKPEGEVEFYASTGQGHNYTFSTNQISNHTSDMIWVNEATSGPVMDSSFGTSPILDPGWSEDEILNNQRTLIYPISCKFTDVGMDSNDVYSVIKGLVTTY